jgi:hypothetical protein
VRIQCPDNLRVPSLGSSLKGKSGPKMRPTGVVDGKQVNIPVLILIGLFQEGRRRLNYIRTWMAVEFFKVLIR